MESWDYDWDDCSRLEKGGDRFIVLRTTSA